MVDNLTIAMFLSPRNPRRLFEEMRATGATVMLEQASPSTLYRKLTVRGNPVEAKKALKILLFMRIIF